MLTLHKLLGIEFPFIQGGMANIATGEFAAAVSNAGALGLIGSGGMDTETLREHIHRCRALTDRPFGVNLMLMNPCVEEQAQLLAEERVEVITTGAGNPGRYLPAWKAAGIKVFPVVAAPILAQRLSRYGVDGFIAEGGESGGHIGEMNTMALVPQVADVTEVPVIAAGGIADGRQIAAAEALGAIGVQMGTCLLVSRECPIHPNCKAALLKARGTDTAVTGRSSGAPVRALKNKLTREYLRMERSEVPLEERERLTLGSLRRAVLDGDVEMGSLMAGQVVGQLREVKPLRDIFTQLYGEYRECVERMGGAG